MSQLGQNSIFSLSKKFKEWLANQTTFSIKDYNFANRCDVSAKEIAEIIKSKHSICHECYNENRCIKLQMPDDANPHLMDDSKITYQDLIGGSELYIVTGALGFIGKHFAKHLLDCGKECILVDKITAASDVHFQSAFKLPPLDDGEHWRTKNMPTINAER